MKKYRSTFKSGKPLKKGDYVYISKTCNGYPVIIECLYEKYDKGLILALGINADPHWYNIKYQGKYIKARRKSCFLWGKSVFDTTPRCHWLDKGD